MTMRSFSHLFIAKSEISCIHDVHFATPRPTGPPTGTVAWVTAAAPGRQECPTTRDSWLNREATSYRRVLHPPRPHRPEGRRVGGRPGTRERVGGRAARPVVAALLRRGGHAAQRQLRQAAHEGLGLQGLRVRRDRRRDAA